MVAFDHMPQKRLFVLLSEQKAAAGIDPACGYYMDHPGPRFKYHANHESQDLREFVRVQYLSSRGHGHGWKCL
jgi:hypothetical protein